MTGRSHGELGRFIAQDETQFAHSAQMKRGQVRGDQMR